MTTSRDAIDALLRHRALRQKRSLVGIEAALRSARASAALDGADFELDWLRSGAVRQDHAGAGVVNGALRVTTELGSLAPVWRRAPLQAIARLHLVAAADLVADDRLGRPRTTDESTDPLGLGPAPAAPSVPARLDTLARTLLVSADEPALVVSAVVHGELLLLRPFGRADGVVARAASRLVMSANGLDPDLLTVPESGLVALGRRAYADAVRGFASGTADGVAGWVRHWAQALALGADEMRGVCDALE